MHRERYFGANDYLGISDIILDTAERCQYRNGQREKGQNLYLVAM
jgi:hypothetical protein